VTGKGYLGILAILPLFVIAFTLMQDSDAVQTESKIPVKQQWQIFPDIEQITCANAYGVLIKVSTETPTCVKPAVYLRLVNRGYGEHDFSLMSKNQEFMIGIDNNIMNHPELQDDMINDPDMIQAMQNNPEWMDHMQGKGMMEQDKMGDNDMMGDNDKMGDKDKMGEGMMEQDKMEDKDMMEDNDMIGEGMMKQDKKMNKYTMGCKWCPTSEKQMGKPWMVNDSQRMDEMMDKLIDDPQFRDQIMNHMMGNSQFIEQLKQNEKFMQQMKLQ